MYTFRPNIHTSKTYNADYQHEDPQRDMDVTVKAVFGKEVQQYDMEETYSQLVYLTTSRPITERELFELCYDEFRQGCSCEYDCCGHYHGGASTKLAKKLNRSGTKWAVPLSYSRNY